MAQTRAEQQSQRGIEAVGEGVKMAGAALPEYFATPETAAVNKLTRQFNRAQRKGDIDGTMTIGEFGNLNPVIPNFNQSLADAYGSNYTDLSSVGYDNPRDFFSGMTPFEQRQYFKNR